MSQRTIMAGLQPKVNVHAGWDVVVKGWESDRVQASTKRGIFGLDLMFLGDEIDVSIGLSGEVYVPLGSTVKVYSGRRATVSDLRGSVAVWAGGSARITQVATLAHASAGGALDIDCDNLASDRASFSSGRGLRFCARQLRDATISVIDIAGPWQAVMGNGDAHIELVAGGQVVLVTDCEVLPSPPGGLLGNIERPEGSSPR